LQSSSSFAASPLTGLQPVLWQGRYWLLAQWVFPVCSPPLHWGGVSWQADNNPLGLLDAPWQYHELPEALQSCLPSLESRQGFVLTPGWVNAHTHLEQWAEAALPKKQEDDFADWLLRVVEANRKQASLNASPQSQVQAKQKACLQSMAALQSSGVTCVADISSEGASLEVLNRAGWRGQVAIEVLAPFALQEQTLAMQARLEALVQCYKKLETIYRSHSRLGLGWAPHSIYNVHPQVLVWLQQQTQAAWFHMHLGECTEESAWLHQPSGSGFAKLQQQLLGRYGLPLPYGPPQTTQNALLLYWWQHYGAASKQEGGVHWLLAHGCKIEPQQWASFLANKGIAKAGNEGLSLGLAHCPQSNLALHGKSLNPWGALKEEFPPQKPALGLGTDGRLSTPELDLRVEAHLAAALHTWSEAEVLEALTLGGAKALGLQHKIGALAAGLEADLALWQVPSSQKTNTFQKVLGQLWQKESGAYCLQRWVQGQPLPWLT
jgi:cytosine/adenosine deaminase-related metal-dependent hydrolase